jgi:peptidoglycan/LPS O-acetylase OafA/YrhL
LSQAGTAAPPPNSGRLPGIEALRGIAAVCVVLLHLQATLRGHPPIFGKGYLAVDFFLMLSGFLMARTQEARFAGGRAAWRFIAKRIRRLWPMMALGSLIGAPVLYLRADSLGHFLRLAIPNFLLLPSSFNNLVYPLNIPAWTIFYELLANALHVLLFWRFGRAALALSLVAGLAVMIAVALHYGSFDVGARPQHFLAGLPRTLFAYLIGIGLGRWWRDEPTFPVPATAALLAMPAGFAASWYLGWSGWLFDLLFVTLACPLIIAGGLRLKGAPRLAFWSGMLSFPLFAVHMPILQTADHLGWNYIVGGIVAIAGGIAVAVAANMLKLRRTKLERAPA